MNRKGQMTIGMIVIAIMAIVAGIAFIGAIFDQQAVMTTKGIVIDETFNLTTVGCYVGGQVNTSDADCNLTIANAPTGWKVTDCPISSVVVSNGTGTALTLTTDYTVTASTGKINLKNTTATSNTNVLVDYSYCRDGYNKDSGSRSMAGMIGLFAVLMLVIALAGYGLKEWLGNR